MNVVNLEHLRFLLEPGEAIRVSREGGGEDLQGDIAASCVSVAR